MSLKSENIEFEETLSIDTQDEMCYHCGTTLKSSFAYTFDQKRFCCEGCETVYKILSNNDMCQYYNYDTYPGTEVVLKSSGEFAFLDNIEICKSLINYKDENVTKITFYIPTIHCSSCIWVLENFYRINPFVTANLVDFKRKQFSVTFKSDCTSIRSIVEQLAGIGYEPLLSLDASNEGQKIKKSNSKLILKIAVAGFCSSNIMMFSFPEYFGLDSFSSSFGYVFKYINFFLSLPVLFFSASDYFKSVISFAKNKVLTLDAPILVGLLATFIRSVYEILTNTGAGYFDSMAGLILFLLVGKWFTQNTFDFLSFERDYKSYFPLAVSILDQDSNEISTPVNSIIIGNRIRIKNNQLIPADSLLYKGEALIDYSYVTGESEPIKKNIGEIIYAGGKQMGDNIELEVLKKVSQSYLTELWNNPSFEKQLEDSKSQLHSFTQQVARYFTSIVLILAFSSTFIWLLIDPSKSWNAFTAILIIACPCTLALSYPIALGNTLQKMSKKGFFLKKIEVIEDLANIDCIVFDKTGTLTEAKNTIIDWKGVDLSDMENQLIKTITQSSNHPLSIYLNNYLKKYYVLDINEINEIIGSGIEAKIQQYQIKIGSLKFVNPSLISNRKVINSEVHISINQCYKGYFEFKVPLKSFVVDLINSLKNDYKISILSGDNNFQEQFFKNKFGDKIELYFNQSPEQKLNYIKNLQQTGLKVLMCGDGLNDAGALKVANVGISVTEIATNFTPACDAIIEGNTLSSLYEMIKWSKKSIKAIKISFAISLVYNCIGLFFAVQGNLQPIVAALLMPLSSVTVVITALLLSRYKSAFLN